MNKVFCSVHPTLPLVDLNAIWNVSEEKHIFSKAQMNIWINIHFTIIRLQRVIHFLFSVVCINNISTNYILFLLILSQLMIILMVVSEVVVICLLKLLLLYCQKILPFYCF